MPSADPSSQRTADIERLDAFLTSYPETEVIELLEPSFAGHSLSPAFLTVEPVRQLAGGDGFAIAPGTNRILILTGYVNREEQDYLPDRCVPDFTTLRPCAASKRRAKMICSVWDGNRSDGQRYDLDPRKVLQRVCQEAEAAGLEVKIGMELEFTVMQGRDANSVLPEAGGPWSSTLARFPHMDMILDIIKASQAAGIGLWNTHPDDPLFQWEVATMPHSPVEAMDQVWWLEETIRELAYQRGLHATFHPRPFPNGPAMARQFNISVNGPHAHTQKEPFVAGMLEHFQAVSAFLCGSQDSYEGRLGGNMSVIARSKRRGPAIRIVEETRWEIRPGDALSSSYLQAAALIAAGLQGVKQNLAPPSQEITEFDRSGKEYTQEMLDSLNITKRLATVFSDALDMLEEDSKKDDGITAVLGKDLVEKYLFNKRKEFELTSAMDPVDRRKAIVRVI